MRLLNLAPHCSVPPMNGSGRRAWHLHENMVAAGVDGHFIGCHVMADRKGFSPLPGKDRRDGGKAVTALSALLAGQDYWQRRMLRPSFRHAVAQLRIKDYEAVVIHFLYSVPLIDAWRGQQVRLLVDTHNYDPGMFAALGNATRNPLRRLLCRRAIRTSLSALRALPKGATLVHVSQSDLVAYEALRPDLNHVVVENGCRLAPRDTAPDYTAPGKKQLLFVGSLSVKQNQDALHHLSRVFWPSLRGIAHLRVAGSNPSSAITALCAAHGWELHPNVSDAELKALYAAAHYALAPFAYGMGSKLKLVEACGHGVPVITTRAGATGLPTLPPLVHVSDEPEEWKRIAQNEYPEWDIRSAQQHRSPPQELRETLDFAQGLSWSHLGTKLARIAETASIAQI
jgi:glycosyltransferase involved in cell wall biosynthesis